MKRRNKRLTMLIIAIALALLIFGGFFVMHTSKNKSKTAATSNNSSADVSDNSGLPRQSSTTPSNNSSPSSNSSTVANSNAPAKPTLNKSSGNNGPIPAGVLVNFVCTSAAGSNCDIILTSKTDASKVVKLGAKTVTSSYGQAPFASWDWTSVSGDWSVVARASNSSGATDSDAQGLKVQ